MDDDIEMPWDEGTTISTYSSPPIYPALYTATTTDPISITSAVQRWSPYISLNYGQSDLVEDEYTLATEYMRLVRMAKNLNCEELLEVIAFIEARKNEPEEPTKGDPVSRFDIILP